MIEILEHIGIRFLLNITIAVYLICGIKVLFMPSHNNCETYPTESIFGNLINYSSGKQKLSTYHIPC